MTIDECFHLLESKPNATIDELKSARKELLQVWHPDKFSGNPKLAKRALEKSKQINDAFDRLLTYFKSGQNNWEQEKTRTEEKQDSSASSQRANDQKVREDAAANKRKAEESRKQRESEKRAEREKAECEQAQREDQERLAEIVRNRKRKATQYFVYAIAGLLAVIIVVSGFFFLSRPSIVSNQPSAAEVPRPLPALTLLKALQTYKYENGWTGGKANSFDKTKLSYYPITSISVNGDTVTMRYAWKNGVLRGTVSNNDFTGTWAQDGASGDINFHFNADFSTAQGKWSDRQDGGTGDVVLRRLQ